MLGFDSETAVKLVDVDFFQETIGSVFGFDAVQTEFVAESALKSFVDAFAATSGLRGISRDRADAEFSECTADLSEMTLEDLAACLWSEEEMAGPVGIQGAEDATRGNAVFKEPHTAEGALLVDEFHLIDFTGGIIHKDEQIKKDTGQIGDPLVSTTV